MNMAASSTRRLAASPYARRLARERSLPLEALRGSGPGGRILAADVQAFVPAAAPVVSPDAFAPTPAPSPAASRIAAFATSVALGALRDLLTALESSGNVFALDDVLLRAAGRVFAETADAAKVDGAVALELTGRQAVFATSPEMSLTSLRAMRLAALNDSRDETEKPAALSLRLLAAGDIRPVTMPLLPKTVDRQQPCLACCKGSYYKSFDKRRDEAHGPSYHRQSSQAHARPRQWPALPPAR